MRVVIASNFARDVLTGSAKVPIREAATLRDLGVDVSEVFLGDLPRPRRGRSGQYSAPFRMARHLMQVAERADVVDIAGFDVWPYVSLARRYRPRQIVVARSNGLWFLALTAGGEPSGRLRCLKQFVQTHWFCRLERIGIQCADLARFMSSADRDLVIQMGWRTEEGTVAIPPGIDEAFLEGPGGSRMKRVVFLGSWISRKGIETVASVMVKLLGERPDLSFQALGCGVDPKQVFGAFPSAMRRQIEAVPSAAPEKIAAELRKAMVLLFPTHYEGYGMATAEAMACGVPTMTTDTGAGRDLVVNGETGLLFRPDDADGFLAGARRLLDDSTYRSKIGRAAAARAATQTWMATTSRLLGAYQHAISARNSRTEGSRT